MMGANSVEIFEYENKLVVRVTEDGQVHEEPFAFRDFALSWAAGQRTRLKLRQSMPPLCE